MHSRCVRSSTVARSAGARRTRTIPLVENRSVTPAAAELETLVPAWLTVPDVAEALGVDVVKVRSLLRERQLLAIRRGDRNVLSVPALFIDGTVVVKGLPGLITLLSDAGFKDDEALRWLFTPDDSLPGTPAQALSENRGTEVKRRAQALAF